MDSLAASAQLSYQASAPADALLALRRRLKASDPALGLSQITLGDLAGFAAVRVLARHPGMNAHLVNGVTRRFERVHLGIAVDTERGLLAPVLRSADRLGLRAFAAASRSLAAAARAGDIDPALLAGGTFTISNLGSFGVEAFTPILNPPQAAILGLGTIIPRPVAAADGELVVEQRLQLSLTADHQVVDGADAGRFLRDLSAALAQIECLILAGD
jgi:pyruvate dehydrogenase E2 component (dihydrolipoamide acetyltransferase)